MLAATRNDAGAVRDGLAAVRAKGGALDGTFKSGAAVQELADAASPGRAGADIVTAGGKAVQAIADGSKSVAVLGAFPLPVEVIAFGHAQTAKRLEAALTEFGIAVSPKLRLKDGIAVRTDSGQVLYDLACQAIPDPKALATMIKSVTGVVEHGLFLGLAAQAIIARDDGSVVTRNS